MATRTRTIYVYAYVYIRLNWVCVDGMKSLIRSFVCETLDVYTQAELNVYRILYEQKMEYETRTKLLMSQNLKHNYEYIDMLYVRLFEFAFKIYFRSLVGCFDIVFVRTIRMYVVISTKCDTITIIAIFYVQL